MAPVRSSGDALEHGYVLLAPRDWEAIVRSSFRDWAAYVAGKTLVPQVAVRGRGRAVVLRQQWERPSCLRLLYGRGASRVLVRRQAGLPDRCEISERSSAIALIASINLAASQSRSFLNVLREGVMVGILVDFEAIGVYLPWSRSDALIWMSTVINLVKLNTQETITTF